MRNYITYAEYLARRKRRRPVTPLHEGNKEDGAASEPEIIVGEGRRAEGAEVAEVEIIVEGRIVPREKKGGAREERRGLGCGGTLLLAVSFAVAVVCALLVSKGLGLAHLKGELTRVSLGARTVYCVQIASPATPEEAAVVSREVRAKGGGGYIAPSDGVYLVLASAYESEEDCDLVIDKLAFGEVRAAKYVLRIPAVALDLKADGALASAVKEGYGVLWQCYVALYDASVALDTGAKEPAEVKGMLAGVLASCTDGADALAAAIERTGSAEAIRIRSELIAARNVMDGVYLELDNDATLSADLKYAYLKLLWAQAALAAEL